MSQLAPDSTAPRGVRIGVDVGTVRVGVAASDPAGILASPVATLPRDATGGTDQSAIAEMAAERGAVEVVVGLPRTLRGTDGRAAELARAYGTALAALIAPVPVVYVDERFTSVRANADLAAAGVPGRRRRPVVDQAAAVGILQSRLDALGGGR